MAFPPEAFTLFLKPAVKPLSIDIAKPNTSMPLKNNLITETSWEIIQDAFDPDQVVTTGSYFMIGNGYLQYRGIFENWGPENPLVPQ
jgi:hypothetical protein